ADDELEKIILRVRERLASDGVFSGFTVAGNAIAGPAELAERLRPFFLNTIAFETGTVKRRNLHFWAADGPLPFMRGWPHGVGFFERGESHLAEAVRADDG